MFTKRIPLRIRFESKFIKSGPDECWLWMGSPTNEGYGSIRRGGRTGKQILTHRLAYEFAFGEPPPDKLVCHKCDNRLCVNPSHLFLGTIQDNNRDRDNKGRGNGGTHPGEGCGHATLKNEQVLEIRANTCDTIQAIAEKYGVAQSTIWNIRVRRTWKHI